ncbi:MAG: VanZ family protein [Candidatus Moraniibacteriota bacterium]
MKKKIDKKYHFLTLDLISLFAWMGVIFYFSSLQGDGVVYTASWQFILERKGAHVFEYLVLTLLFLKLFTQKSIKKKEALILAILASLLYALTDEIHQLFVFGREGKISDVLIDLIGISLGGLFFWGFIKIKAKLKK